MRKRIPASGGQVTVARTPRRAAERGLGDRTSPRVRIDEKAIRDLAERIVRAFQPEKIILFGSYANGTPTASSDVDLLVVLRFRGSGLRKSVEIAREVRPAFPVDLIVRTPGELRRRLAWDDFFLREIVESGRVLYEAAHP